MDISHAVPRLSALAQPTRLRVMTALGREHPRGLPVGTLAERVDTPPNTMSGHLAILARAGLVVANRAGRTVSYSVDVDALEDLRDFLGSIAREAD